MKDRCFNIYYLNLSKVYELSMMINNTILTSIKKEKYNTVKFTKNNKVSIGGSFQTDSDYLASIKSVIESGKTSEKTSSSKIVESLDIKTTKSILLNKIKNRCIEDNQINSFHEGDLIKLDNVKLSILDRDTLQQMLLLKRDALKGMEVEGMEINNIVSSMIKDYSYVLVGTIKNNDTDKFIIKIPFEIENEFENNYNVDDILLGNVSLIGIYKSKNKLSEITSNTLNYFMNNSKSSNNQDNKKFIMSNDESNIVKENNKDNIEKYHYIDIIAIIQEVKFKEPEQLETKLPWYKKIFNFLKGKKNYDK